MKKIWIAFTSLLLSLVLCFGVVGCASPEKATISVTVNGGAQTNGCTVNATVDEAYTIVATSSNDAEVSASYVFGADSTAFTGSTFTPKEEGSYVFTFTADGAVEFKLTFNATKQSTSANQYTVTFALGTHSANDANEIPARTVVAGTEITLPAAPKAESGYTFGGWSDGSKTYAEGASYTVNSKVTLTAVWGAEKFIVSYSLGEHAAQGATTPAAQSVNLNTNIQLPAQAVAAENGYIFMGWSDGTTTYDAGEHYIVKGNVTFTAVYEEESKVAQVTVKFALGAHAASSATAPASQTVDVGSSITLPSAIAAESGYLFDGWSVGAAGASYIVNAPVTITALWKVDHAAPVRGIINGSFETGDLTGWTVVSGDAANVSVVSDTEFWTDNASFYDMNGNTVQKYLQEGEHFIVTGENTEVALKSSTFTLEGDGIITFKFGGGKHATAYIALCDASTNEELIKVTNSEYFSDPTLALVLLRKVMYANDYIGRSVYIKVADNDTEGFGFINFDDLKVSLTLEEAEEIIQTDKDWAANYRQDVITSNSTMGAQAKNIINAIRDYYSALTVKNVKSVYFVQEIPDKALGAGTKNITEYLSETQGSMRGVAANTLVKSIVSVNDGTTTTTSGLEAFNLESGKTYTVTYRITDPASGKYAQATFAITVSSNYEIINGGFETGNLSGWTVVKGAIDLNGGVSNAVDNGWREKLPYNKTGEYFCANAGLDEHAEWELKSTTFTLGGNGFISFKMASQNAILKVYKADGTQIYSYTCKTFKDEGFPHVENGGNWCTLRTHYADLSAYKGEQLYITIGNIGAGAPWEFGHFDDIVTYYAEGTNLSTKKDTVLLTCVEYVNDIANPTHSAGETTQMPWIKAENEF